MRYFETFWPGINKYIYLLLCAAITVGLSAGAGYIDQTVRSGLKHIKLSKKS